jgi:hypothetical protein
MGRPQARRIHYEDKEEKKEFTEASWDFLEAAGQSFFLVSLTLPGSFWKMTLILSGLPRSSYLLVVF